MTSATQYVFSVLVSPTRFDLWVMSHVASTLGKKPAFDQLVLDSIHSEILGGLSFAAVLFVLWVRAQGDEPATRRRIVTIFIGSLLSVLLTLAAASVTSWPPPANHPQLAHLYPEYLSNANTNSFPSQSTALYSAIAAGVWSISRPIGALLWFAVLACIALPRVYVGGHYPTDIVIGLALGIVGYWLAKPLEPLLPRLPVKALGRRAIAWIINLAMFAWILQVALEFGTVGWVRSVRTAIAVARSTNTLDIGGDEAFEQYFRGRIDEVRIYSRALSPDEILRDMNTPPANDRTLVAAYTFDEGEGSIAKDISGNGNNGTLRNITWVHDGKFGGALQFNGKSSRVEIRDSPSLHLSGAMTLEAWVYPTQEASGWQDIIYKEVDVYFLEAGSNQGRPAFSVRTRDSTAPTTYASSKLPLNTWTHVAGTYDGTYLRLYLNGMETAHTP
jgi:membrane-associated phospholipid phosphatase